MNGSYSVKRWWLLITGALKHALHSTLYKGGAAVYFGQSQFFRAEFLLDEVFDFHPPFFEMIIFKMETSFNRAQGFSQMGAFKPVTTTL